MEKVLTDQSHFQSFLLSGAPQLSRPVEVDSYQIKTLTEDNQHYTTQEKMDILQISKSNFENYSLIKKICKVWERWNFEVAWKMAEGSGTKLNILFSKVLGENKIMSFIFT